MPADVRICDGPMELREKRKAIFHSYDPAFETVPVWINTIEDGSDDVNHRYSVLGLAFPGTVEERCVQIFYNGKTRKGTLRFIN